MRVDVGITIAAPPGTVWAVLTDWEAQADWMPDARAVHVLTRRRTGEGVTLSVPTRILGVTVDDRIRVTGWEPPERLEVVHVGRIIRGRAAFELAPHPRGTTVSWWEQIDPPLGAAGAWAARLVVAPLVRRVFRRSLWGLRERCEVAAATSG